MQDKEYFTKDFDEFEFKIDLTTIFNLSNNILKSYCFFKI